MNVMASDRIAYSTDPTIAKTKSIKFQHFKFGAIQKFFENVVNCVDDDDDDDDDDVIVDVERRPSDVLTPFV